VNKVDVWGLFRFGERPLDGPGGVQIEVSSQILNGANIEGKHVQGFYEDGTGDNVGFSPDGLHADTKHPQNDYTLMDPFYPDEIAREAERSSRRDGVGEYKTFSNNCQGFRKTMTSRMYDLGRYFRGSALDPR